MSAVAQIKAVLESDTDEMLTYIRLAIGKVPGHVNAGSIQKVVAWKQAASAGLKVLSVKRPTKKAIHFAFTELRRFDDVHTQVSRVAHVPQYSLATE